jgi:hypothetical protein
MANTPALVKKSDLARYVKAVLSAGVVIGRVTIGPDGTVNLYPAGAVETDTPNPCDRLLK